MPPSAALVAVEAPPLVANGTVAAAAVGEPPSTLAGSVAAGMGLVVAPSTGRFRAHAPAGMVGPGTPIGAVTGGGGRADEVIVPVASEVCGLLVIDGQLVQSGQALAWIRLLDV